MSGLSLTIFFHCLPKELQTVSQPPPSPTVAPPSSSSTTATTSLTPPPPPSLLPTNASLAPLATPTTNLPLTHRCPPRLPPLPPSSPFVPLPRTLRLCRSQPRPRCRPHRGHSDITTVDILDSPPLVHGADPHDLHFFNIAFDIALFDHLQDVLFPSQTVAEMEPLVRHCGTVVEWS